jgi:hypothetical protein
MKEDGMTRLLVLMGSGETTPTMVTTHQRILTAVGDGPAVVVDTPYGFQENADELTDRTLEYFARNVGREVGVVSLRDADAVGTVAREVALAAVGEAAWVFAGPGSPTYLARQWRAAGLPGVLAARLADERRTTATVLASAAACTAGRRTVPVYELYKVGEAPHWQDGLDLLRPLGLDAIVVPHYDNAEGGTHDTSCCYVGDRRLRVLEGMLDATEWVLGVDEHTAAVLDLAAGTLRAEGRGRVVVRLRDRVHEVATGTTIGLDEVLGWVAAGLGTAAGADADAASGDGGAAAPTDGAAATFDAALARGDLLAAAEVTAGLLAGGGRGDGTAGGGGSDAAEVVRQVAALARVAQAGWHEHRDLVAPRVGTLLALRERARAERRFGDADAIRDALVAAGVEVHDARGGTGWEYHDPLEEALPTAG